MIFYVNSTRLTNREQPIVVKPIAIMRQKYTEKHMYLAAAADALQID